MPRPEYLIVDPSVLVQRKLQRQMTQYGTSVERMPAILVYRGSDGGLLIFDGVTRATRAAQLQPPEQVRIEVTGELAKPCKHLPTVGDTLP